MLRNPSHLCLPKQLSPCLLLPLLCTEAALSPAEPPGAQPCTSPVTPLESPAIKSDAAKIDWVMVVAAREQLESPIPPLPCRTREAHSQQQRECQRKRLNICCPFRACTSLVPLQQATEELSDTSQHSPIILASSKATLAAISADIRYELHLQNFHCLLEENVLTSAACRVTSNMYTHSRLWREMLPFCF